MSKETILLYKCNNCGKIGKGNWGGETLYLPAYWVYVDSRPLISKRHRGALCPDCKKYREK